MGPSAAAAAAVAAAGAHPAEEADRGAGAGQETRRRRRPLVRSSDTPPRSVPAESLRYPLALLRMRQPHARACHTSSRRSAK